MINFFRRKSKYNYYLIFYTVKKESSSEKMEASGVVTVSGEGGMPLDAGVKKFVLEEALDSFTVRSFNLKASDVVTTGIHKFDTREECQAYFSGRKTDPRPLISKTYSNEEL